MTIKTKLERLERALNSPPEQEPYVVVIRAVGRPGPSQEKIEAAKAEAREQGRDSVIVWGD
ncbi:MAG TPA: hypothetical protein DD791_08045 [Syntrophomonas sp.]|jgi:hypothetical protein|nr:hypothetical protein [Syntrophomonas sp.]